MTNEEITVLAKSCGHWSGQTVEMNDVGLLRFAELVAEKERISRKASQIENELLKEALAGAAMKERRAVWAEREACAQILRDRIMKCEAEAQRAIEGGEQDEAISLRATAWQLSVCRNEILDMGRA